MATKEGLQHVTAYLCANGAADAIEFYKRAFGAEERYRLPNADGTLGHAEITVGETTLFLSDEWAPYNVCSPKTLGGNSVSFVLRVQDVDAAFRRATDAGATVERPITEAPFGRGGWIVDPFGQRWNLMTPNPDFHPDKMR